jgi:nitroimidazol reductase NimA-like FMN-containing flavoprotein (pyridoxamine 5'-phosphate oxidase superfamily)
MRRKEREITGIEDLEGIILRSDVCRIALTDGSTPYIVTMNFGYLGGADKKLYFHCAPEGRKIEMIRKNNYVCFEMDTDHLITEGREACDFGMKFSSIVGWGKIFIVTENAEKKEGLTSIIQHYSERSGFTYNPEVFDRTTVLRLEIISMTGKKI